MAGTGIRARKGRRERVLGCSGSGISEELSRCFAAVLPLLPLAGVVAGLGGLAVAGLGGRGVVGVAAGLGVRVLHVGGGGLVPLGGHLVVPGVEPLRLRAVEVEPPVADEVLLVEDGADTLEAAAVAWSLSAATSSFLE